MTKTVTVNDIVLLLQEIAPPQLAEEFDGTKADVETSNDPAIPTTKVTGSKVDMSAGLFYRRKSWYVGASMAHILSPTVMLGETNELKIDPVYYLTGGYNIKLRNPLITIHRSICRRKKLL